MAETNPIELQKALKGAEYPSSKDDLVKRAKDNGAGKGLVDQLAGLKENSFDGPDKVQKAVFGH
ncbi:DUF2795 domain-containing protein [Streptomyces sp. TRM 70351]|uniref:DUF2795 domain-containing protein n=1 Tax=Streptomyces sp. TRM 70351 TaxID=3116552 RepID=UPI002E7B0C99|nr:DUF2795 domain-containing protein [Streptomyces sp. TRM 70351]MEE1931097.1 DUF2795 domain-containing protein [Streptomyces sp. TRM 70351]